MSPLTIDLLKILVDKLLLGIVAAGFGYYLSRLLEDYKFRNSYRLALLTQRNDACKATVGIVVAHHSRVAELQRLIHRVQRSDRPDEQRMEADMQVGKEYIESHGSLITQLSPYMTHLSYQMMESLNRYIEITNRVSGAINQETSPHDLPDENDLNQGLQRFLVSYHDTIIGDTPSMKPIV